MERVILHCDLNNYFASVECIKNPNLKSFPVAVCGNTAERHGIVLAKNNIAKKFGVITGEPVVYAKNKCRNLVIIPPNYEDYIRYSNIVKNIYYQYTEMVEPFGIDECWLDVTDSESLFGSGYDIAWKIKEQVKAETKLTLSVGVSYNKAFAKLGSDMKKPDAVTVITKENFKSKVWNLPADTLLGVGHKARIVLRRYCINTIGDLANASPEFLQKRFGKNGLLMNAFANGLDPTPVMAMDYTPPLKSIGHGITTTRDLKTNEEVFDILVELAQVIGDKLKAADIMAKGVTVSVRDSALTDKVMQCQLPYATQSSMVLVKYAKELFANKYVWHNHIRSVTIRAINLKVPGTPEQLSLFVDYDKQTKIETVETVVSNIRNKYGTYAINPAVHYKSNLSLNICGFSFHYFTP